MKKIIISLLAFLLLLLSFTLSGCSDDYTAQDLQDAKGRYFNGTASKSDKNMVEGFYKWKNDQ